jgi:hypothetical protein
MIIKIILFSKGFGLNKKKEKGKRNITSHFPVATISLVLR